jgi:hypothetical protein
MRISDVPARSIVQRFVRERNWRAVVELHAGYGDGTVRPTGLHQGSRTLLVWSSVVRGKALGSLEVDDCGAYKDFLKGPIRASSATASAPSRDGPLYGRCEQRSLGRPTCVTSLAIRGRLVHHG